MRLTFKTKCETFSNVRITKENMKMNSFVKASDKVIQDNYYKV